MYLVELRPGKEELYRSTEELAAAIRSGDVDAQSRIYHRATSKWISVTLHPQYKAIVSERTPQPPPPPPLRTNWTFFNDSADSLAGANDPDPDDKNDDGRGGDPNHPWRRPLALTITGALLILGLQLAASGPKPPWVSTQRHPTPAETARPAAAPAPAPASEGVSSASLPPEARPARDASPTISLVTAGASWTELNRGYLASADEAAQPAPAAAPKRLPAAPVLRPKALLGAITPAFPAKAPASAGSVLGFLQRWSAAQDSVLARLESGMRVARLDNLFASDRFSPAGGVTETRMSLAGAANFVRIYRQQQAAIDRRFQESFAASAKANGWTPAEARTWYARTSRVEDPQLASLTSSLIQGVDSLLGVLDAQAGTYRLTRNAIHFEDPTAAREYMALRERILGTLDSAKAEGGADQPGPMSYLLRAIGSTHLPIGT